ncbi:Modification methylase EcoRI [Helicobacter ailurogastricus]|uniref:Modification methylase EcoRI n=3 Tax=Helicobacter ailurogastricus TaxID=1578720 RepID=A0A0K2Y4A5_9HELI|nr:Modification methylase EcoRI [Helicobacter ailurogastricus]
MPLDHIPDTYKKFDDNGVLLVDHSYIPSDYTLPFAVSTNPILNGVLECGFKVATTKEYTPCVEGKRKFKRMLICRE